MNAGINAIVTVASKEFRDGMRNRWIVAITIIFAILAIGLAYFGLLRGGCICPVGATTNFCIGLAAPELIGKTVAILFLLPLIAAFFFGRVFFIRNIFIIHFTYEQMLTFFID